MGEPKRQNKEQQVDSKKLSEIPLQREGFPGTIVEIIGRTGVFGEIHQVMIKIMSGKDEGRVIRRNVKGPVKKGDVIVLLDTERESKPIKLK